MFTDAFSEFLVSRSALRKDSLFLKEDLEGASMRFWRAIFKLRLSPVHALKMKILQCRGCLRSAMLPAPIPICRNMTFQHQPRHSVCHLRAHGITYMEDRAWKKQKGVQNTHTHTQTRAQDICSAFTLADLILPKYAQQKKNATWCRPARPMLQHFIRPQTRRRHVSTH